MGGDFGQWDEWNHDESLSWHLLQWEPHQGLQKFVADLNHVYCREPSLYEVDFDHSGFEWIDCHNHEDSTLSYVRRARDPDDFVVVCTNFTPVPRYNHWLGVPELGRYDEILNSDSTYYGGSNVGNKSGVMAKKRPSHSREHSIQITLPPLATLIFKPRR